MWRKKKWIIIGALAAIVILVAGIAGGVAYADSSSGSTPSSSNPGKSLPDRVATILGLDQTTVENAFAQAQKDMQDEALNNRLQSLVSQGKLTQDQADSYKAWLQSKPELPQGLNLSPGLGPQGHMGFRGGFHGFPGKGVTPPPTNTPIPSSTTSP
jgi:hypothetical protein